MCVSFSLALFDMQNQSYHNYMLFPIHSTRYLSHEHNTHSLFNSHPNALTLFWSISGHQSLSYSVFLIDAILSLSLYTLLLHSLSLSLFSSLMNSQSWCCSLFWVIWKWSRWGRRRRRLEAFIKLMTRESHCLRGGLWPKSDQRVSMKIGPFLAKFLQKMSLDIIFLTNKIWSSNSKQL